MTKDEVLAEFRAAGALLEGHFVLSSGLHSPTYMQCARVLMDPKRAERLCAALAQKVRAELPDIDLVVSPAMGGVVVGYEMGRQLGVPAIFTERVEGTFALRRGFDIAPGARCLMVEDVVTTGLSSRECMDTIRAYGGEVVGAASLVDRSNGTVDLGVPYVSLLALSIPTYEADKLPEALAAMPVEKPGSRTLKS
ncbi:MAG: orotate phosphoribosyltransferase [Alphaproteobacteria bacterium]|nr:orotate phosphoribosyltransferase [Alphaproteobacteria bacterium]MDX5368768.1 orotate phosphoribosyltransferase [Alphaproteobacteria bacterium]MDX5463504.1 orotate phosphoribosyltransferase [Alphaproteobacteria bacterium]